MTDLKIAGVEVARWAPTIVLSDHVTPSPQLDQFGYRAPARFSAPDIWFSPPQPLLVIGGSFTIVAERSGLVPASTYLNGDYGWDRLFTQPRKILPVPDGPILVAANAAWINYSHWIFQCLPPILLAAQAGLQGFHALLSPLTAVQRDYIALAGLGPADFTILPEGTAAVSAHGIYSNLTSGDFPLFPHPAIIGAFERLAPAAPRSIFAGRRVFLSRADTRNRIMRNEAELSARLEAEGYAVLVPGALSLMEQIALFRDAAMIVGQHGAAMTNLLFSPPGDAGPIVVELHQDNYPHLAFVRICQVKRLRYTAIFGRMVDPGADGRHDSTWEADIPLILRTLAAL